MAKPVRESITVPSAEEGQRLDRFIKSMRPHLPYVAVQKLLRTGGIRVDGHKASPALRLAAGQVVEVPPEETGHTDGTGAYQVTKEDKLLIQSSTLYEDETLLVLNKPAGLATQAGAGQVRSLDRILVGLYDDSAPRLTHRLDKETTGILVLAKTRAAAADVAAQFAAHQVEKIYLALLSAQLKGKGGDIHLPLLKVAQKQGARTVVDEAGDAAHTSWKVVGEANAGMPLVVATPHTGRMNQLRVHFASLGAPIAGDGKYGGKHAEDAAALLNPAWRRTLFLHAWKLTLRHPVTGVSLKFESPLPHHFETIAKHIL